jgi:NhaP-type Na+/H+ or K+/H+ antiporter
MHKDKSRRRHLLLAVLLWMLFGAGLLVQVLAPQLEVADNAFVIPPALIAEGNEVRIAEIVERQRQMAWFSAVLTVSGALGLALYYYRDAFARARSASRELEGLPSLEFEESSAKYKGTSHT